jgi:hypothetical protein
MLGGNGSVSRRVMGLFVDDPAMSVPSVRMFVLGILYHVRMFKRICVEGIIHIHIPDARLSCPNGVTTRVYFSSRWQHSMSNGACSLLFHWRYYMRKKTIAWFFIIGLVLAAVGSGINGAGMVASTKSVILTGVALTGIGAILLLVSWIGALVAIGKQSRWGWFVLVFLLSGIGELIYLIGGPALG